jgi:predicted DNA-binding transcriptional regulator AlpA
MLSEDEMMKRDATCAFFGGIHYSTLYRGIAAGRYPKPIHIGPNSVRWLKSECQKAVHAMIQARDDDAGVVVSKTASRSALGRAAPDQPVRCASCFERPCGASLESLPYCAERASAACLPSGLHLTGWGFGAPRSHRRAGQGQ